MGKKKKKKKFTGTSPSDDMTGYAEWQRKNWPAGPPPVNVP
jgi:hypothetical protein